MQINGILGWKMRKSCSNVDTGDTINYKGEEIKYLQRQCYWNVDVYSRYS
jgi:hypothetical protein